MVCEAYFVAIHQRELHAPRRESESKKRKHTIDFCSKNNELVQH